MERFMTLGFAAALSLMMGCIRAPSPVPAAPLPAASDGHASFERGYAKIFQGDLKTALELLEPIAPDALSAEQRASRQSILDRFKPWKSQEPAIEPPFTREIASIYQTYWTKCFLKETTLEQGNADLLARLKACLDKHGKQGERFRSLDELTDALGPMLLKDGFHSICGVTSPYYELMLWRKERSQDFQVGLPESMQHVKVVFMSDFVLQGWLGYATCGRSYSGGWTAGEALYCYEEAYDLDSENFRISYLAHEGQHFSDNKLFPKLKQPELEYRAKLVELAEADGTLFALLDQFSRRWGADRNAPHPYANGMAARHLSKALFGDDSAFRDPMRWSEKSKAEIQQAARRLLLENTEALKSLGSDRVERIL